jgi:acylpyruvate hydrolase
VKLATIDLDGAPRAVVVRPDGAVPVNGYADVGAMLRDGDAALEAARRAEADGEAQAFTDEAVRRPITRPGAIVCVGLNYRTHILEMGRELPTAPALFSKLPRALTDPYADIELPAPSDEMDYEGELAVVIGRGGRHIRRDDAWEHVAGLTVLNDVTARDYQWRSPQWFAGKTFQQSTPMGPWLVTPDELGDVAGHQLTLSVNGDERQRADLADLVFDVPALVADLSKIVDLEPGDVIATGTPGGVGAPTKTFLQDGDVVEVAIDGIGWIRNTFKAAGR